MTSRYLRCTLTFFWFLAVYPKKDDEEMEIRVTTSLPEESRSKRGQLRVRRRSSGTAVQETEGRRMKSFFIVCTMCTAYIAVSMVGYIFNLPEQLKTRSAFAVQYTKNISSPRGDDDAFVPIVYSDKEVSESYSIFAKEDLAYSPPYTFFYNVYAGPLGPEGKNTTERVLFIAKEQIEQLGTASSRERPAKLFYNTVGRRGVLNETYMKHLCAANNMECFHMAHHTEGFEEVTLQRAYDYCQYREGDETDRRVVYLHNKGSYHFKEGTNEEWRRSMTRAVSSELCLTPPDDSCSVCGLVFNSMWMMVFPGNFWTAKCSYIRKLHPPKNFDGRMETLLAIRRKKIAANHYYRNIFPIITDFDFHGRERFAALHWVGSHPSLVPCDLTDDLGQWFRPRDPADFDWSLFPRSGPSRLDPIRQDQYLYLGGNLLKWYTLYNEGPPDSSWAFKWFPDGDFWKGAMHKYGNQVVDKVVANVSERRKRKARTSHHGMNGKTKAQNVTQKPSFI